MDLQWQASPFASSLVQGGGATGEEGWGNSGCSTLSLSITTGSTA